MLFLTLSVASAVMGQLGSTSTILAAIPVVAFTIAELGKRVWLFRTTGLETATLILLPSYAVHSNWIPSSTIVQIKVWLESLELIGMFVAVLIFGSIFSMQRTALIKGFARSVAPVCAGSIVALLVGTFTGALLGSTPFDTLFLTIIPIFGGGVSAGALPLSIGYAEILGVSQGKVLGLLLPAVIVGSFMAMVCAGFYRYFEKWTLRRVAAHGGVRRIAAIGYTVADADFKAQTQVDAQALLEGIISVFACYFAAIAVAHASQVPTPLVVLVIAGALQFIDALPTRARHGVSVVYHFSIAVFTCPILFSVGLVLIPWDGLMQGFAPKHIAIIVATVASLSLTGFFVSRWTGLHAVDGAIIATTRAAMGGTGDIAILSAAGRMDLMPFAQAATRIGGGVTVAAALSAIGHFCR